MSVMAPPRRHRTELAFTCKVHTCHIFAHNDGSDYAAVAVAHGRRREPHDAPRGIPALINGVLVGDHLSVHQAASQRPLVTLVGAAVGMKSARRARRSGYNLK